MRQIRGRAQGAERLRAPQEADTPRPDVEDVLREDRQQRHDTAEQHGGKIEGDRAENGRVGADEGQPRCQCAPRDLLLGALGGGLMAAVSAAAAKAAAAAAAKAKPGSIA